MMITLATNCSPKNYFFKIKKNITFSLLFINVNLQKQLISGLQAAFLQTFKITIAPKDISLQPTHKSFAGDYTFVTFPWVKHCPSLP